MTDILTSWERALAGLRVLAARPTGLGGVVVRMRAGPARDNMLGMIRMLFSDVTRISPNIDNTHLFGGIDLTATLGKGEIVQTQGLLYKPRTLLLSMAERCPTDLAAKLGQYLDEHPDAVLIALDEGVEDDERIPDKLAERLAFSFEPQGRFSNALPRPPHLRSRVANLSETQLDIVAQTAQNFGIRSMRAPLMAMRASRVVASLNEHERVSDQDLAEAVAMVYGHRATRLPPEPGDPQPPAPAETADKDSNTGPQEQDLNLPDELVVAAVRVCLPPEVLAGLGKLGADMRTVGAGQGQRKKGNRRGRPLPSRRGQLNGRNRLDLLATLRAAAPWQKIRAANSTGKSRLHLRPGDFRVKRYESRSDRLIVFAVDASGSAAVARLNETKGAIELILGQAYAARDHVALISFRGQGADCLLPPTRSLVQTKRKLSSLPGGGGTPLASGLQSAMTTALLGRSKGMNPVIVLMTDGKSNIALDGTANRDQAHEDAHQMANHIRRSGLEVLVLDTGRRPSAHLRGLSQHLDATYLPLPRANAEQLSNMVQTALETA